MNLRTMASALATAVGIGAVAAPITADAAIVYSGVVDLTIPATTGGLYLNVVTGVSSGTPAAVPGWDVNVWSTTGLGFFNPATPTGGVYVVSAPSTVDNLAPGESIGGASTFGSQGSTPFTQWALNSSDNLFGFRFINEGDGALHYGWARLGIGATITQRRVVEYAYESDARMAIVAGATSTVPEPGTFGLLAIALAGLASAGRARSARRS